MAPRSYSEARQRERDVILPGGTTHARRTPAHLAARRAHRGAHDGQAGRVGHGDPGCLSRATNEMTGRRGDSAAPFRWGSAASREGGRFGRPIGGIDLRVISSQGVSLLEGASVADWVEKLVEEARTRWSEGRLLLLSQIPAFLRDRGIDLTGVQAGRPLLTTLRKDCAHELSFFQDPENPAVWAALPSDVSTNLEAANVFASRPSTGFSPTPVSAFRFKPWFWAAFVKQIETGKRRWVLQNRYLDASGDRPVPPSAREVVPDDVVYPGTGQPVDSAAVSASIEAWVKRNGVDLAEFNAGGSVHGHQGNEPVRRLAFESLDSADLRRIKIPMDIVLKLIAR